MEQTITDRETAEKLGLTYEEAVLQKKFKSDAIKCIIKGLNKEFVEEFKYSIENENHVPIFEYFI